MLSANDRNYVLSLEEFTKRQRPLRLDAFEHYSRGLLASEDDARLRELREAARLCRFDATADHPEVAFRQWARRHAVPALRRGRVLLFDRRVIDAVKSLSVATAEK